MRILFADDDPDERALASRVVGQEFPEAVIVGAFDPESLESALNGGTLDLLVTDYDLRWIDGFAVFDKARAAHPTCRAIMFTGTGNEELAVRAMKHGFDDYVVKSPAQRRRLAASARAILQRRDDRLALEESRDLVLQELYHRLHNNLQIVISLIRQTEREVLEPAAQAQLRDLGRRIQALSTLQEHVYRSGDFRRVDFKTTVASLSEGLVGMMPGRVALEAALQQIDLAVDTAVPLTLIVSELLTNIAKHAFPDQGGGVVQVRMGEEGTMLVIVIRDNGIGLNDTSPMPGAGLGRRIIEKLAAQIGAQLSFFPAQPGTECQIRVPL